MSHTESSFITLTYADENLPYNIYGQFQLCKKDVQDFMKRLRKLYYPKEIRYYFVGEYGERFKRPHYHAIIFGINIPKEVLEKLWTFGIVHVGTVTPSSIQYVAGYVLKKFVNKKRDTITPEFSLMSRRPGIGFYALQSYKNLFDNNDSFRNYFLSTGCLPSTVQFDGRTYPLDRYFKWKLYDTLDVSERQVIVDFTNKILKTQHEAFKNGFNSLVEYEDFKDKQKRLNKISKVQAFSKRRLDL